MQRGSNAIQRLFAEAVQHHQAGRLDDAIACYRRVLERRRDLPEAHFNLGIAIARQGRFEEAVTYFRMALSLKPDYLAATTNLGVALKDLGRLDEATACFRRAIARTPDVPELHYNLGNTLRARMRLDDAVDCLRHAIALRPDYVDAHCNLSLALLARGDAAGWDEFEWRWKGPLAAERRPFTQPQWRGDAADGKVLLIHAEQGFGDTLQFCRFAPQAAARGLRVILEVQKPLVRLLRDMPGVACLIARGEALPPFDFHCPMLSLPLALGITLPTIPWNGAYLRADPAQAAFWQTRLAALPNPGKRIGVVWAGNARSHTPAAAALDRRRSIAPERLAPLFAVSGCQFISLQKDGPPGPLPDFMAEMADFADTASLIVNLDLVIAVDTAVAHLAAALGKPVWLLNRFDSCWRWLSERTDTPWYPTLRLYRQPRPGDWNGVIASVVGDLACARSSQV